MYQFEVSHVFGSPQARLQADGLLAEVCTFAPDIGSLDHCLSHHLLLSWLSPYSFRMQARFEHPRQSGLREFGNLAFIPAGLPTLCRYQAGSEPHRVIALRLAPHLLERLRDELPAVDARALASCDLRDPDVQDGMRQLAREVLAPGFASSLLVESLGAAMLVRLVRRQGHAAARRQAARGGLAPWQMRRISERLADAGATPTLDELASLAGVSQGHLRRAFKQSTGRTVGEHIRQVQFARACALLSETDLPLQEIGAHLGFSSRYGFAVAFERSAGLAPSAFRRQARSHR